MGGNAFLTHTPPLPTPRMPPSLYFHVKDSTQSILRTLFTHVSTPVEPPGKLSYGDVDIVVFGSRTQYVHTPEKEVLGMISKGLGAVAWIDGNETVPHTIAIRWPAIEADREKRGEEREERYIQVDLHIAHSVESFNWKLFHSAHGDLWNILGSTIRPFGLLVNPSGLHLRIPEIEHLDRKKSMIHLTSDPNTILSFLNLDSEKYWKQFQNLEELFRYAAQCRLFWVRELDEKGVREEDEGGDIKIGGGMKEHEGGSNRGEAGSGNQGQEGGEKGKKKLKHNDRQRIAKRPIFREWIEDFIPKIRKEGNYDIPKCTREDIRYECFSKFDVEEEYSSRLSSFLLTRHRDTLWRDVIKGSIPPSTEIDPVLRGAAIRVLKGVILEGEEWEGGVADASKRDEGGFWDVEKVKGFVVGSWERAGEVGLERLRQRQVNTKKQSDMEERETRATIE